MSWRDWYPNVQCMRCGEFADYRECQRIFEYDGHSVFKCQVCQVVDNLEGLTPLQRLMSTPSVFEKRLT